MLDLVFRARVGAGLARAAVAAAAVLLAGCAGGGGGGAGGAQPGPSGPALYALLSADFAPRHPTCCGMAPESAVEVVDLATMRRLRSVPFGFNEQGVVRSLAVSRDGARFFVLDVTYGPLKVYDGFTGAKIATVAIDYALTGGGSVRDCVLSPDDSTLYVTTDAAIVAVATDTLTVRASLATGAVNGIALSPDGRTLGAVGVDSPYDPALFLADASTLALVAQVPISDPAATAGIFPSDLAFTGDGRAVLWDGNLDKAYQVDVASRKQSPSATIRLVREGLPADDDNNVIAWSGAAGRAYALTGMANHGGAAGSLVVIDPAQASGLEIGGFDGPPFALRATPDGSAVLVSVMHRYAGGGPDTLDRVDAATGAIARGVYTFSRGDMSVRDMVIR